MQFVCQRCAQTWGEVVAAGAKASCPSCHLEVEVLVDGMCSVCHKPLDDHYYKPLIRGEVKYGCPVVGRR